MWLNNQSIKSLGYLRSNGENPLSLKHTNPSEMAIPLVYVGDIVTGNNTQEISDLENKLSLQFEIKSHRKLKISCRSKSGASDRTKHVNLDYRFIKEKLKDKIIIIQHTRTHKHCADLLTRESKMAVLSIGILAGNEKYPFLSLKGCINL